MNRLQPWVHSSWSVPVVSGLLILLSFGIEHLGGGAWNVTVSPQWWIDARAHAHGDRDAGRQAGRGAVAVETADIALMGDNLMKLPESISLAPRTVHVMRQNITIALITVVLLLTGVFAGGVTMSIGMLVREASVLVVMLNAMRLTRNDSNASAMARELRSPARRQGVEASEEAAAGRTG